MATTFEIFPAIGIARVGTSNDFFIGPEPDVPLDLRRRDNTANHNLLRQAARFRVFQCERDASGKLLGATEITAEKASVEWTVHLLNRKAVGPRFHGGGLRNNATGDDQADKALIIDPGERSVNTPGANALFDTGTFLGQPVRLGGIQMEQTTRLLVFGGFGKSESPTAQQIGDFADNDGWHDDVSDGPVRARLTLHGTGQVVDAVAAWVIVTPPDYAPEISNLVTLYDVLYDVAVNTRQILPAPATISYRKHIRPILERALGYQWVNGQAREGFGSQPPFHGPGPGGHGPDGPGDFTPILDQLGDPTQPSSQRQHIFRLLRDPAGPSSPQIPEFKRMPRLNDEGDSGDVFSLTKLQYQALRLWANGQFVSADPADTQPELLPDALTRVALEACAGGPFFPGIEAGRIMRDPGRYLTTDPFRLSQTALKPGEITQHNAVPWQADFHLCRWEEADGNGKKRLGWWPAQRPDDVLKTVDADSPVAWTRGLADQFQSMIAHWHQLGFVKRDPTNPNVFTEQDRDPNLAENGTV